MKSQLMFLYLSGLNFSFEVEKSSSEEKGFSFNSKLVFNFDTF